MSLRLAPFAPFAVGSELHIEDSASSFEGAGVSVVVSSNFPRQQLMSDSVPRPSTHTHASCFAVLLLAVLLLDLFFATQVVFVESRFVLCLESRFVLCLESRFVLCLETRLDSRLFVPQVALEFELRFKVRFKCHTSTGIHGGRRSRWSMYAQSRAFCFGYRQ